MRPARLAIGLTLALLPIASAWAQWQASVGVGLRQVRMVESDQQGRPLVREQGQLPGLHGELTYQTGDWRLSASGGFYQRRIGYHGQVQDGPAFVSHTDTRHGRIGFEAAHALTPDTSLVGGFEWDHWRRDIEGRGSTLGLREHYSSWRWLAGARTLLAQHATASLTGSALLVLAQPEQLQVQFSGQVYDEAHLKTRSARGLRLALTLQPALAANLSLTAELDVLSVKRSDDVPLLQNGVAVGAVAQPRHDRQAFGLRVDYRF
ncbi:MAG: hypothetical protein IPO19_18205 [Rhodoferax sp.]|nr:hypothetical protein [Rhodoferax sp.]